MTALPYKEQSKGKKVQVAEMFNNIAGKYDFLNHLLSLGIDKLWRKKAISILKKHSPKKILDIATGTGDFAIEALKTSPDKIIGIDISEEMLKVGIDKITKKNLQGKISLHKGDSEDISYPNNHFDATIVAFGVRNFENLNKGLVEMHRVLKPNGISVILEFSKPKTFPFKQLYNFYFKYILPKIGSIFSKDKAAYTYLPESVKAFPDGQNFINEMQKAGFTNTNLTPLTFGIATIYIGQKM